MASAPASQSSVQQQQQQRQQQQEQQQQQQQQQLLQTSQSVSPASSQISPTGHSYASYNYPSTAGRTNGDSGISAVSSAYAGGLYPTVSADNNSAYSGSYPQLASRYDYDAGKRVLVGVKQHATMDELSDKLSSTKIDDEEASPSRHLQVVQALRNMIAQQLQDLREEEAEASDRTPTPRLYPSIEAC
jgi:hypothetical protein